jgi:hypothetical protein
MHLVTYIGLAHRAEQTLADSFRVVGLGHAQHPDVLFICQALADLSDEHVRRLTPIADRYGEQGHGDDVEEPERLHAAGLAEVRSGPVGLLRDLSRPACARHPRTDHLDGDHPGGTGPA